MSNDSTVLEKVQAYLAERRQAGCTMHMVGSQLKSFVRFAQERGHRGPLTSDLLLAWAQASRHPGERTAAARLTQILPFAQFCHRLDARDEIPPAEFFGPGHRHRTPHIFSIAEIRSLIAQAAQWRPSGCLRGDSYATLFGLLAATGLRISEALALQCRDIDLEGGVIHVRDGKFHKARYVPLHATTVHVLQRYADRRDHAVSFSATQRFFLTDQGQPLKLRATQYTFSRIRAQLGWRSRGGHPAPRIHDLRFTFICRRLEQWYAQGVDIDRVILSLCTYAGHVNVTSTYWYLTATPKLMRLAARRFQRAAARSSQ